MGRFINADDSATTGQGLLGNNMFTYCLNNPTNLRDVEGRSAILTTLGAMALGGTIGAISNAITTASNGGSFRDCALGALAGFIGGAIGTGVAALMTMCPATLPYADVVGRGAATLVTDLSSSYFINGKVTKEDFIYTAFDVTTDMLFSTMAYYYNPVAEELTRTVTNATIDALTDIGQNELFNSNSVTNRNSTSKAVTNSAGIPYKKSTSNRSFSNAKSMVCVCAM